MHGVTTVFGGNCGFTLAPGHRRARRLPRAPHGARRGHPAAGAAAGPAVGLEVVRRLPPARREQRDRRERRLPHRALGAAARRDGRRRWAKRPPTTRSSRWNGTCTTRSTRARWASPRRRRPPTTTATAIRCRRARRRARSWCAWPERVRSHPGTQLELIIAGCLNGFTDDEVDLMTSMSLAADRPLNWNVLGVPRRYAREATRRRHRAARAARASSRSRCPQGMKIRLSFLTGFVLDGLPGWRETMALPVPERIRPERSAVRARLDEQAHSPEAGVLANLARWERLEVIEGFTPADQGVRRPPHRRHREGTGQGAVRRAARHRGRRRAAHRAASRLRRSRSPKRRGRCASTCGAIRGR